MHTTKIGVGNNTVTVFHNGDYSGRVEIYHNPHATRDGEPIIELAREGSGPMLTLKLDMEIILEIAAEYRRDKLMARLENMSTEELLSWTELNGPGA